MDHYTDISILPDSEFPATVLMNAIYSKFHKALCELSSAGIGISFPEYKTTLGTVLRIHSQEAVLNDLQGLNWIGGMSGYCNVSGVLAVPVDTKFRIISRKQPTMSQSKLNRLIKRGHISEDNLKLYKIKMLSRELDKPYVELISGSTGQKYRRYIEFGELLDQPVKGEFDQFGLSKTATVPWFD